MEFYAKILILALIQGAAELLPVSSSAHVILAQKLMGLNPSSASMVFLLIMLHTGSMFAAIVYFWSAWKATLFPPQGPPGAGWRFVVMIVLATAVTGVLGLGLALVALVGFSLAFDRPANFVAVVRWSGALIGTAMCLLIALDAAAPALEPASTSSPTEHAGSRRLVGRRRGHARRAGRTQQRRGIARRW